MSVEVLVAVGLAARMSQTHQVLTSKIFDNLFQFTFFRVKTLEDKLARFRSERERAEQQLNQTVQQLRMLEQIVNDKVKN
jgi:hypothetical protein